MMYNTAETHTNSIINNKRIIMKARDTLDFLRELVSFKGDNKKIAEHIFQQMIKEQSVDSAKQLINYINEKLAAQSTVITITVDKDIIMISTLMLLKVKECAEKLVMLDQLVSLKNNLDEMETFLDDTNATLEGAELINRFASFLKQCESSDLTRLINTKVRESQKRMTMSNGLLRAYLCSSTRSEATKLHFLSQWEIGYEAVKQRVEKVADDIKAELDHLNKKSSGVSKVGMYKAQNKLASYNYVIDVMRQLKALEDIQIASYAQNFKRA